METTKEENKFVIILNKKIEMGVAINAAAHMVAALMKKTDMKTNEQMRFMNYLDGSNQEHLVSALSLIVLRADNSNKIRNARLGAIEKDILFVDFTESMTGDTYIEQMERTKNIAEDDMNYYGICMFGVKKKIDEITSKFSLWR